MKRHIIGVFAILLSIATYASGPRIEWLETEYNFGAFNEDDGNVTCYFRFVNTGDAPLTILSVRTSCGCTTSKPPREAIAPGDTASVSATYNPTGRPGRFEKRVYVDSNTSESRTVLTIEGTVIGSSNTLRSRYPIDAGSLKFRTSVVPFGEVMKGNMKNEFFEVYNVSSDTIYPRWEQMPPYLRATCVHDCVPPGEQIAYALIIDAMNKDIDYGILNDTVYLSASNGEPSVPVNIVAMVSENFSKMTPKQLAAAPVFESETKSLDFGSFPTSGPVTRSFKIYNRGKDTMIVRRAYTADPGISVKVSKDKIKKGKSATVEVTVDPSQLPSELLNARISLIVNDPNSPTNTIRVVGIPENK